MISDNDASVEWSNHVWYRRAGPRKHGDDPGTHDGVPALLRQPVNELVGEARSNDAYAAACRTTTPDATG